ncbi:MAG TPA: T9SS type A sorting domain-containing protein [Bacteroidales bacterium]|nr:T9SS type A sorting domain-containing protein [Bacteroidales bacterium]
MRNAKTASAPDGWFNRPVWIAFVLITDLYVNPDTGIPNSSPGGSNLAVDNIHIYNDVLSGISDNTKNMLNTLVYPNPAFEKATILIPTQLGGMVEIFVTDIVGRMVYSVSINATENQTRLNFETNNWGAGIYMVKTTYRDTTGINKLVVR